MKTASVLLLLNDKTKKLYAFSVIPNRNRGVERQKKGNWHTTPCYVVTGATYQWTYFLVIPLDT